MRHARFPGMRTDSGFSAGLALGIVLVVLILVVILATVPIGSGPEAKPLIDIKLR
jgi:hypothetical protein